MVAIPTAIPVVPFNKRFGRVAGSTSGSFSLSSKFGPKGTSPLSRLSNIVMTPEERRNPKLLNPSRKARIARGAGVDVSEVNRLVKQFEQTKKFMKQMPGMMGGKKGRRGGGGLGGLFKGLPF